MGEPTEEPAIALNEGDENVDDENDDASLSVASVDDDEDDEDTSSSVPSDDDDDDEEYEEHDNNQRKSIMASWISSFAVFGDSPLALALSFLVLILSLVICWYVAHEAALSPEEKAYRKLGALPRPVGPTIIYQINTSTSTAQPTAMVDQITEAMKRAYRYDGVVAVRGLISQSLLSDLQQASDQLIREQHLQNAQKRFKVRGKQFFTVQHGVIFHTPETLRNQTSDATLSNDKENNALENPFVRLLVQSDLPQVAAILLQGTTQDTTRECTDDNNLRVLRDIFLAKDDDPFVCGWHVDDHGFWPAIADAPGINAWIALDDYNDTTTAAAAMEHHNVDQEGGFALAVGSHRASWRHEAYQATGSAHTAPNEGFSSAADMVQRREGSGTCNIKHAAPHLQRRLEETKRVYRDLQAGDIIFHDRWVFHRTIPQTGASNNTKIRRRYSVRLGPGSSIIPRGYGIEPSVLYRDEHGGKTADQVSETWPWYLRVWPSADDSELASWREFCDSIYPVAIEKQTARKKEMKPHLQKLAQKQQIHPQANNLLYDFSEGYS